MLGFKDKKEDGLSLVPAAQKLIDQINNRWASREKSDQEIITKQDSREITISKNLEGSSGDSLWLANQLLSYCKGKKAGSIRVSVIHNGNEVASGNHPLIFWTWRNWREDVGNNIKVIFNSQGESDSLEYDIPILVNGQSGVWNGEIPFYDRILTAVNTGSADRSVWNLACRLKELGFIEEAVLPEGRQKYPKNAIRQLQDYMGLDRTEYNEKLHRMIWGEFRLSIDTP